MASHEPKTTLRDGEKQLDRSASVLDVQTDISFRETIRVFMRIISYFGFFKARIVAKLAFITLELAFRLMIVVWPAKIVVDHVILGQPIAEGISGFPSYFEPFLQFLDGKSPLEIMLWIVFLGAAMVIVFGSTVSDVGGRSRASASMAQGHDIATQTENEANRGGSQMGGILGLIDFRITLRLMQSLNHLLRTQLAAHVKELPMTTLDDQRIGDSVYRVLYDTTSASLLLEGLTLGLYSGILGVVISLVMMVTNYGNAPEVIVIAMLGFPVTLLLVLPLARVARRRSQASRAAGSSTTSNIEEGMSNVLAVQSLGGNKREGQRFSQASQESFKRFRTESFVILSYNQLYSLSLTLGQVVFFIVIAGRVIDGTFTAGDYFVVSYYFFQLYATFGAWGHMYTEWQRNIAGMRRVFFLMDLQTEKTTGGVELPRISDGIVMDNAGLTYPDGRVALRNINLKAHIGEIVAFVGPTGAGKTSLAYLAPAYLQATEGKVSIDGIDLKDVSVEALRDQVSYVFQETQLFSDSILNNIRYGKTDASMEEVEQVSRVAGAHNFIMALPEGYATDLGTVTSKLSVGQKQRIAIARGLLRDARILILDEPTSALDPETESYLVDALHQAAKDKLVIIIAHRLSTIASADRIYFLQEGEIREQGSHEQLMAIPDGYYRDYVRLQAGTH